MDQNGFGGEVYDGDQAEETDLSSYNNIGSNVIPTNIGLCSDDVFSEIFPSTTKIPSENGSIGKSRDVSSLVC